MNVVYAFSPDS